MARFLIWSDLHCEFAPFDIPVPADLPGATPGAPRRDELDAILIAGDTDVKGRHVDLMARAWDLWRIPVLAVNGNHEPYGSRRYQKHEQQEHERVAELRAAGMDIQVLRRDERIIGDTRVIGATLWTDFRLYPDMAAIAPITARSEMNDYRAIRWFCDRQGVYRKMIPTDTAGMHAQDIGYILDRLAQRFDGRTLVMTHHPAVMQVLNPGRLARRDIIDAAYTSDLWPRLGYLRIDGWISGHCHDCIEVLLEGAEGETAFLSNPRGYPMERTRFNPLRVIDSNDLRREFERDPEEAPAS